MAKDAKGMKGYRPRNKSGRLRDTRKDKKVGTLEKQYGRNFGVRSDMYVATLLERFGVKSVSSLLKKHVGPRLPDMPSFFKSLLQNIRGMRRIFSH